MPATPTPLLVLLRHAAAFPAAPPLVYDPSEPLHFPLLLSLVARGTDVDAACQYNRARFYDPTPGRWLTADPLAYDAAQEDFFPYPQPPSRDPQTPAP